LGGRPRPPPTINRLAAGLQLLHLARILSDPGSSPLPYFSGERRGTFRVLSMMKGGPGLLIVIFRHVDAVVFATHPLRCMFPTSQADSC